MRVKQQNLVYVIGLVPQMKDEQALLQTLRGPEYFGQYGDIDKIVVSKAKPGAPSSGVGVYVTYARKEDAAMCISTIDGSVNGDRVLRAQFGTTKYCSAFLRGATCTNKNCSFLHETGEDGHSSSLQGEVHTKKSTPAPPAMAPPARPNSTAQSISSQPMARQGSKDSDDRKGSTDGSALPSTASWANTAPPKSIRRASGSTSRATPSPQVTHAALASQKPDPKPIDAPIVGPSKTVEVERSALKSESSSIPPKPQALTRPFDPVQSVYDSVLKSVSSQQFKFVFSDSCLSEEERDEVENFPVMIDPYGGAKRRVMQDKEAAERARLEADAKAKLEAQATSAAEEALEDVDMGAGSLALGGEPEVNPRSTSGRGAIGRPSQPGSLNDQFPTMSLRSLTPQQRQQIGLTSGNTQQAPGLPQPPAGSTAFQMSDFDKSPATFSQAQYDQISNHQRHGSRYFNSEHKSNAASRFQGPQQSFYSSGVQGPPPGLPASGTPPVSGGGMFAHGNNFSNAGFGTAKDANTDPTMRARSGTNAGPDVSKRELLLSLQNNSLRSPPQSSAPALAPGLFNPLYSQFPGAYQDPGLVKQRKKGKKHRHANTSSSGGGEHLADPSILQARLHQGNSTGQGLFGGNQGGYQQSSLMYGGGGGYNRPW